MNFFGLNSAALNGAVSSIIAGAALVTSISSVNAEATKIQFASASIAPSVNATSNGTRVVLGGAISATVPNVAAQWSLLASASIDFIIGVNVTATPTDAHAQSSSSGAADGFITQSGECISTAQSTCTADPLVTVGYASNITIAADVSADASVKLNGTTQWQRDGYLTPISISTSVSAGGLKTALPTATAQVSSSAISTSILQQSGASIIDCTSSATAQPSIDFAGILVVSDMTAHGTVTRYCDALIQIDVSIFLDPINTVNAAVDQIDIASSMTAEGRHAILGAADSYAMASISATGRFAQLGCAEISSNIAMTSVGMILAEAEAPISCASGLFADPVVIKYSHAQFNCTATVLATGAKNLTAAAPEFRAMRVPVELRVVAIPFEDRTMKVTS